jgi:Raf kinase inhibitor-like YbhB/YbcL family protein
MQKIFGITTLGACVFALAAPAFSGAPPASPVASPAPAAKPAVQAAASSAPAASTVDRKIGRLIVTSTSFTAGSRIPDKHVYCAPADNGKFKTGANQSPHLSWSGAPKETKFYAIVTVDPDVPANFDKVNQDRETISRSVPRRDFYHWVLINIPAATTSLPEGVGKGVPSPDDPLSLNYFGIPGVNDYQNAIRNANTITSNFVGYDGPCPPWNDTRLHNYRFIVYALGQQAPGLFANFRAQDVLPYLEKYALAKGELVGTYSTYKKLGQDLEAVE